LYTLAGKYLYPGPCKFKDDEIQIFKDAVRLGYISDCDDLAEVDYACCMHVNVGELRCQLNIETSVADLVSNRKKRHPEHKASCRLV
jgi:hypothetical protein